MTWRVGNHYGIHVYDGDKPVATFHRPEDAKRAVDAVNAAKFSEPLEDVILHMLVRELGGHSVTIVSREKGRRLGFSCKTGRSIAIEDIIAAVKAFEYLPDKGSINLGPDGVLGSRE